jgi:hypothetical protein
MPLAAHNNMGILNQHEKTGSGVDLLLPDASSSVNSQLFPLASLGPLHTSLSSSSSRTAATLLPFSTSRGIKRTASSRGGQLLSVLPSSSSSSLDNQLLSGGSALILAPTAKKIKSGPFSRASGLPTLSNTSSSVVEPSRAAHIILPPTAGAKKKRRFGKSLFTRKPNYEYKHECPQCDYGTDVNTNYKAHKAMHEGVRYPCTQCGKHFTANASLQHHVRVVHEKRKDHQCLVCGKKFGACADLKRHTDSQHNGVRYKCPVDGCSKNYAQRRSCAAHMDTHHPGHNLPYP